MTDPPKDRSLTIPLALGEAEILYLRNSGYPVKYALILRVRRKDEWVAVLSVDNSHEERPNVEAHHLHRYADGVKKGPESLPFPVSDTNDAMSKVIDWMAEEWEDLSSA